ncbi:MAG: type II secretion system protein [Phycisphaerae bacterium]
MRRKKGFTLIELLVVIAIIALLVSLLVPALGRARELARRIACGANIRSITQSLALYAQDNYDQYPSMGLSEWDETREPQSQTNIGALWSRAGSGTMADVQTWYLLIHSQLVEDDAFGCPSDGLYEELDRSVSGQEVGWDKWQNISYGFQPTCRGESGNVAYPGAPGQDLSGMVVVADRPGDDIYGHSPNHGGDGENASTGTGTVTWASGTAGDAVNVGYNSNNIWIIDMESDGDVNKDYSGKSQQRNWPPVHASDSFVYHGLSGDGSGLIGGSGGGDDGGGDDGTQTPW